LEDIVAKTIRSSIQNGAKGKPAEIQEYVKIARDGVEAASQAADPKLTPLETQFLLSLAVADLIRHRFRYSPAFKYWTGNHVRHGESTGTFEAELAKRLKSTPPAFLSDVGLAFLYQGVCEAVGLKVETVIGTGMAWKGYLHIPIRAEGGFEKVDQWATNVVRFSNGQIGYVNLGMAMLATEMFVGGKTDVEQHRVMADFVLPKTKFELERYCSLFTTDMKADGAGQAAKMVNYRPYNPPQDLGFCSYDVFTSGEAARSRVDRLVGKYLEIESRLRSADTFVPAGAKVSYEPVSKADLSTVEGKYPELTKAFASGKTESVLSFFSPAATFRGYFAVGGNKVLRGDQPISTYRASVEEQMRGASPPKHFFAIEDVSVNGDVIVAKV